MKIIDVNELTKVYKISVKKAGIKGTFESLIHSKHEEKTALDHVSFSVTEGESIACIGENGAGKSTLIKLLIGILTPTSGEVLAYGKSPTYKPKEYLRKIGVIFGQKTNLWTDIPVIESYNAVKTLYNVDATEFQKNFDMIVELLELAPILSSPARKLSLGQRMKADIGMVFLHSPQILFLDEPTIGLDINVKHTIRSFIRQMNKEKGVSVFLTSHDLDDIDQICDDTIVLSQGKLFYDGSLDTLKKKYASQKTVNVTGKAKESIETLLPKAKIEHEKMRSKIVFNIDDYTAEEVLSSISKAYDIDDITIQEPDIDSVVSQIFSEKRV